jgi:hypothetical protein
MVVKEHEWPIELVSRGQTAFTGPLWSRDIVKDLSVKTDPFINDPLLSYWVLIFVLLGIGKLIVIACTWRPRHGFRRLAGNLSLPIYALAVGFWLLVHGERLPGGHQTSERFYILASLVMAGAQFFLLWGIRWGDWSRLSKFRRDIDRRRDQPH